MGIKLTDFVTPTPAQPEDLKGKIVAVDVANLLYPAYSMQLLNQLVTPEKRANAVKTAYRSAFNRVFELTERGARPIFVFDGEPHRLKTELLAEREANREKTGIPRLTRDDYDAFEILCRQLGLPTIHATHDAELEASQMEIVDVVATTDWDALAMGAKALLRGLASSPEKWTFVHSQAAFDAMGVKDREQLVVAALLMGCDYTPGLPKVGPKKALKLATTPGMDMHAAGVTDLDRYDEALRLMMSPPLNRDAWHFEAWQPDLERLLPTLLKLGIRDTPELRARLARLSMMAPKTTGGSLPGCIGCNRPLGDQAENAGSCDDLCQEAAYASTTIRQPSSLDAWAG